MRQAMALLQPQSLLSRAKIPTFPPTGNSYSWTRATACAAMPRNGGGSKIVRVWTENKEVMTASVERGWHTFVFPSEPRSRKLAQEWSSIAMIRPLYIEENELIDAQNMRTAKYCEISSPTELEILQPNDEEANDVVINFKGDWQVLFAPSLLYMLVIPAENIVAAFQGCKQAVLAVSTASIEAKVFLEALELGLDGVVLKVEDVAEIFKLKDYFDRRDAVRKMVNFSKATVTKVEVVGMGDRVCVDLCNLMQPGEGLLVGSFARGLFLVHSECLESNYIASRPFRVNAGPVHAYVAIPGEKTCYLSELKAGREVIVVDPSGSQRTAMVGHVKIESRPLILVEAKDASGAGIYSLFLQNAETVGLVRFSEARAEMKVIAVTSLKVGDEVIMKVHGSGRHTGIEIQEFIVER